MASVHDKLKEIDERDEVATILETVADAAGAVDSIDTNLRDLISKVEDHADSFDDYTVKELKAFMKELVKELTEIKDDLY